MDKADVGIKCAALRALGAVFVQHPRLMLACAQSGLVDCVMASDSPLEVQLTSFACWKDISVSEERRIDSGEAKKKMDQKKSITTTKKISGDQDGDSTLVGSVLAKQAYRVFQMTQSKEAALRVASLELLAQLLRQGLVNPNDAVPYLLALQGDVENLVVRKNALNLLIAEGEKRPDMLRQRVCAGIKQAFSFSDKSTP
jgi:cohesin loading factor subunit SCC2